jgi:hypothetical protein
VRLSLWEYAVIIALAAMTATAARSGIWLLFFLVAPAARSVRPQRTWSALLPGVAAVSLAALSLAVIRGPLPTGASRTLLTKAIALAHGTPILAEDIVAEQVALAGGRVWMGNPIEAFSRTEQSTYLNWQDGMSSGMRALRGRIRVVLTLSGGAAGRLMARARGFRLLASDTRAEIYVRTGPPPLSSSTNR